MFSFCGAGVRPADAARQVLADASALNLRPTRGSTVREPSPLARFASLLLASVRAVVNRTFYLQVPVAPRGS